MSIKRGLKKVGLFILLIFFSILGAGMSMLIYVVDRVAGSEDLYLPKDEKNSH